MMQENAYNCGDTSAGHPYSAGSHYSTRSALGLEQRIPEPELMTEQAQVEAYANADFSDAHNLFVAELGRACGGDVTGAVFDAGCGPGDIMRRCARAYPHCTILGLDGSREMIEYGRQQTVLEPEIAQRITFAQGRLPDRTQVKGEFDVIMSNSLLHHLPDPMILWTTIRELSARRPHIFIMDLMRPANQIEAHKLVELYAKDAPDILKRDFFNSLCAAYRVDEVEAQLQAAGLTDLVVRQISDRHLVVKTIGRDLEKMT